MAFSVDNIARELLVGSIVKKVRHTCDKVDGDVLELDIIPYEIGNVGTATIKIRPGTKGRLVFEVDMSI